MAVPLLEWEWVLYPVGVDHVLGRTPKQLVGAKLRRVHLPIKTRYRASQPAITTCRATVLNTRFFFYTKMCRKGCANGPPFGETHVACYLLAWEGAFR